MLTIAGLLIVCCAVWDIIITTITVRGGGPVTSWTTHYLWTLMRWTFGGPRTHALLAHAGVLTVLSIIGAWVVMLWGGWFLVFLGSGDAIVTSSGGMPADTWSTFYFAGYTLFTLGLGDFRPVGELWQVLTAVCAGCGLFALTLSVTYFVPVLSAVAQKQALAATITSLGATPEHILRDAWDGDSFASLDSVLSDLHQQIVFLAQQHLAYPALHYFHSAEPRTALPLRLAALDEALLVLRYGVRPETRPQERLLALNLEAISYFLHVLNRAHIRPAADAPPKPSAPCAPEASLSDAATLIPDRDMHRRLMLGFVENDGWTWEDVHRAFPSWHGDEGHAL
jgi:hypothetical protein